MRFNRYVAVIILTLTISPLFGVFLAESLGYQEPLDVAAETLGLEDMTGEFNWTPFLDYSIPGLPEPVGYILSGVLGVIIILLIGRLLKAVG